MMDNSGTDGISGGRTRATGLLFWFVTLPFLLHFAWTSWNLLTAHETSVTLIDIGANALALISLAIGILLLRFSPSLARKYAVAVWTLILSLTVVELALPLALPERADAAPWLPTKQVSTAADTMPGISGDIVLTVNSDLGLRAPQEGFESADLRLLCLGGSSTECLYVTDEKTWPHLLQQQLSTRLRRRVFVGNGGRSGHFTLHTIEKIKNYSVLGSFDLILVMSGINDMGTLLLENYDEREDAVPEEALIRNPYRAARNRPYYARSRLLSELLWAYHLRETTNETMANPNTVSQDAVGEWYVGAREMRRKTLLAVPRDSLPKNMDAALDRYRANLKKIIELSRDKAKPVVFVTQPTIYEEQMPQKHRELLLGGVNPELGFAYTERILTRVMNAYNNVLLETSASEGVECIDLARVLPKDTSVFYDDCHFNISGCEKVASVLADHLSGRLAPTPVPEF